jgi:tetratricopeptide (TPR) repeat protein
MCVVGAFFAYRFSSRLGARNNNPTKEPPPATSVPATNLPALETPTQKPPLEAPSTSTGVSPEVDAANELVNQNPGDPNAHLQLSLAYYDAGQSRQAMEELAQAANLAGGTNKEFFLKAADEYKKREAWIAVAGMYLRVAQTFNKGQIPDEVSVGLHESVYKAAEHKEMPLFVFFERIDAVDLAMGYVARGRYALYNGTLDDAKLQLANAEKAAPTMYEVFLLKAEIDVKEGKTDEAKGILLSLSSDLGAPDWVRLMADNYLKTMQ